MEWKYAKELKSVNLIYDYERLVKYTFCDSFRNCVITNNGGRPSKKAFDTDKVRGRELKSFLSFNKDDRETVWKIFDCNKDELMDRYISFAIDNYGNLICFDTNNDKIVFVNHEDVSVEIVADNFNDFMNRLY